MRKRRKKLTSADNDAPNNFLAKIHISTDPKSLSSIQAKDDIAIPGQPMPKQTSRQKPAKKGLGFSPSEVDRIWKNLNKEKINLEYACIGYSMDNRAVLDYNLMIDLLINYGFKINDILQFMDEFEDSTVNDNEAPIVMISQKYSHIMTDIEPLK